jgi:large subunit ribosomal protein L13
VHDEERCGMRSYMAKQGQVDRGWHLVDADGLVVGRLASRIATILMGKHRPVYTSHIDTGEFVVVVNCEKVRFTGRKPQDKVYYHYTGWAGGLRTRSVSDVLDSKPEQILYLAVRRMLPKTRMGKQMLRKLKLYAGPEHPHEAQAPQPLAI